MTTAHPPRTPGTPAPATAPPLADAPEEWPVTGRRTPFDGAVFSVRSDTVVMPDGRTAVRDIIEHPGAVAVVAVNDDGRVLLQSQYRHPIGRRLWELPAGLLDADGESPLDAARRELYEEAHLVADDWRVLADYFASPGGSQEAVRVFLARGARPATGPQYEREHEETSLVPAWSPLADLVAGVLAGRLQNPTAVVGILALHAATATGGLDTLRPADAPWPEHPRPRRR